MSNLSLLLDTPGSWPIRAGRMAIGVGSGGLVTTVAEDGTIRTLRYRSIPVEVVAIDGGTTVCESDEFDQLINLEPAAPLAAYTVTLPPDAVALDGQEVVISTLDDITSLTIDGATTIRGWATGPLLAGGFLRFAKIKADTWARVG